MIPSRSLFEYRRLASGQPLSQPAMVRSGHGPECRRAFRTGSRRFADQSYAIFPNFAPTNANTLSRHDQTGTCGRAPGGRRRDDCNKLHADETDQASALSRHRARRGGRRLLRHEGGRPLPLARGRQLGGYGRLGRRRERRDERLPLADSVPRGHPPAPHRAVELPQAGHSLPARRCLVLVLQQRTSEPVGALLRRYARRQGPRLPRSQRLVGRRDGGAVRRVVLRERQLLRLCRGRVGFRLGGDPCARRGVGQADRRPHRVGEVLGRHVGSRLQGLLL